MGRRSCPTCGASTRGGTYCTMCGTYLASPEPRRRLDTARDYVRYAADSARSWSGAGLELRRLRRELRRLERARSLLLYELGAAVYADDEKARAAIVTSLRSADEGLDAKRGEMRQVVERFEDHVQRERLSVQPTEVLNEERDEDRATAPR